MFYISHCNFKDQLNSIQLINSIAYLKQFLVNLKKKGNKLLKYTFLLTQTKEDNIKYKFSQT